jgi:membrane associated rhomboid family serine protease
MYSFYLFGKPVETAFVGIFQEKGKILYLLLYLSALFFCLLPTYSRNRENASYRSLGASGAVSAVIFAYIILSPLGGIGLIFIPGLQIPGFIFGFIYLVISSFLDRRGRGNINHSAHIWGAIYGIVFLVVASYLLSDYPVFQAFIRSVQSWFNSL